MSDLGKIIPLAKEEIEIYLDYDFGFFLKKAFDNFNVPAENRQIEDREYRKIKEQLMLGIKHNKKQTMLLVEGNVRKMHSGGLLPSLFNLSEAREVEVFDFEGAGLNHANFEVWRKYKRRQLFREKLWALVIKLGAALGILLALFEVITKVRNHFHIPY